MVGNTCLDHTEKPPSRPTDYVIRHILHVSRPNSNVGSEWRKSTRTIDRISQRSAEWYLYSFIGSIEDANRVATKAEPLLRKLLTNQITAHHIMNIVLLID
jgi:hypothetical protein